MTIEIENSEVINKIQKVIILKKKLMAKIDDLFDYFGIDYYHADGRITSCCPVHHGDNYTAFNINIEEDNEEHYGRWFCNTKQCHLNKPGKDVLSLLWMLLEDKNNKEFNFPQVLKFAETFCRDVKVNVGNFTINKLDPIDKLLKHPRKKKSQEGRITRAMVRSRLRFPCQYYIERGFTAAALDHFDVGLCVRPGSQMHNRVVFPVYDEDDKYMVGCVGRTVCGDNRKWINQKGFNKSNYLYNYGKALKHVEAKDAIILVEGQGDVIRLYEADIKNAVGIFGSKMSDSQEYLIQKTGVSTVVIITDNDEAGQMCAQDISERFKYLFNIRHIQTPTNDIGDMTVDQIHSVIQRQLT
ncbi:MAG: toprim domain-containing protein [Candidatus Bathyarchaeota archaeon]|nr:toprim domain-containing protein [Candidatus Bathyarchaeota archaeon]